MTYCRVSLQDISIPRSACQIPPYEMALTRQDEWKVTTTRILAIYIYDRVCEGSLGGHGVYRSTAITYMCTLTNPPPPHYRHHYMSPCANKQCLSACAYPTLLPTPWPIHTPLLYLCSLFSAPGAHWFYVYGPEVHARLIPMLQVASRWVRVRM